MSDTTQFTTFADLYQGLLKKVRMTTGVTATDTQAKQYINTALQDIHLGFDYKLPWCEQQAFIRTKAPYSTGTASLSVGSTSLTGSSTLWNTANSYGEVQTIYRGKFIFSGTNDVYRVSSISSDTAITLNNRYVADSALSAGTYIYFEDEYALNSRFLRPIDMQMFSIPSNIALIPRNEFRQRFPVVNVSGKPRVACIIEADTSASNAAPIRKVLFYPYPDKTYIIPYSYISNAVAISSGSPATALSGDSDEPIMPLRYRHAIVFHALYHWYRDRKDDARAEMAKAEYVDIMQRIVNDQDIAAPTTAQLIPQVGQYLSSARAPYSYRGGRKTYDLNDEFDSFKR